MTDIVERLRKLPRQYSEIEEAAAEIEALRGVLDDVANTARSAFLTPDEKVKNVLLVLKEGGYQQSNPEVKP